MHTFRHKQHHHGHSVLNGGAITLMRWRPMRQRRLPTTSLPTGKPWTTNSISIVDINTMSANIPTRQRILYVFDLSIKSLPENGD